MFTAISLILISLFFLIWSARHVVTGALGLTHYYRISPLFFGFTIVALGTTSPEIIIAINSALAGKNDLAMGNAIGSNIANIGLVLGISALFRPLQTQSPLIKREYSILFLVMILSYLLIIDGYIGQLDGILLLIGCLFLMLYYAYTSPPIKKRDSVLQKIRQADASSRSLALNIFSVLLGFVILPISTAVLIHYLGKIALLMGISELATGLTLLAIGSSLPELVTSLAAVFHQEEDLALGTILGSNMFNTLIVLAFPGIINPQAVNTSLLWRDVPVMFVFTGALVFLYFNGTRKINRWHGVFLLLIYICYLVLILATR